MHKLDSRYRMPTRLEVVTVFRDIALPYSYYHSAQRILCYDAPSDYGIKVNSTKFGTGYYLLYVCARQHRYTCRTEDLVLHHSHVI